MSRHRTNVFLRIAAVSVATALGVIVATALPGMALAADAAPARASAPMTLQTLIDRAQIEDLLVDYYAQLGRGNHDFSRWFAEDGVLDVNGEVGRGKAGIEKIYRDTAARGAGRKGTFKMLLTNLQIRVDGDKATADMIWTGLNSETVTTETKVLEQGHEHDELVKRDGRWVFSHRVVTSDGGMHPALLKTYKPR
jgi:ketosteroid isomerase-like protein